jgi:membrane protein
MNFSLKSIISFISSLRQFILEDIWRLDFSKFSPFKVFLIKQVQIIFHVARRFQQDRLMVRAAALVYATLLSIVPLLAVTFSLLKGFGYHNELEPFLKRLLTPLGEQAIQTIVPTTVNFVGNANVAALGAFGFIFFLLSSISIVNNMERAFNDVWSVEKARSVHRRIGDYLSVLILGPVLAFAVLAVTASLHDYIFSKTIINIPLIETLIDKATPYITSWIVFCFLYIFIPNTKVRFPSALYGALIAGTIWQLINFIFSRFIVTSYQSGAKAALYASFAVFPLFLVWLYFSWTVVLLGAETAYVHQNRKKIIWEKWTKRISWRLEESIALKIMLIASQKFCQDERAPTLSDLAEYLQIPEQAADKVLDMLIELGLVNAIGREEERFAPAKCLEGLSLPEILTKLRAYGIPDRRGGRDDAITHLVDEIQSQNEQALKHVFDDTTLRDLLSKIDTDINR